MNDDEKILKAYISSLDSSVTEEERAKLEATLRNDPVLAEQKELHDEVRTLLARTKKETFGPYFASRVVAAIQKEGTQIADYLTLMFNRFSIVALGCLIALIAINVSLTGDTSFRSIFGINATTEIQEDIVSFDYAQILSEE